MDARGSLPPPGGPGTPTTETRECTACLGTGWSPIESRYVAATGTLTVLEGPCVACKGTGQVEVYVYGANA